MRRLATVLAATLAAGTVAALPGSAQGEPDGSEIVIAEAYVNAGSTGATYRNKFVELHNPTEEAVDVSGWSVQYRSYASADRFTGVIALGEHEIPAGGTLLVGGNSNADHGEALPTPDVASSVAFSGNANGGTLALARSTSALSGDRETVLGSDELVDLVGYGASTTFEGSGPAAGYSVTASLNRDEAVDTDDNAADFTAAAPTPQPCGEVCDVSGPGEPGDPEDLEIAEIQGEGDSSPVEGEHVRTTGVVTAAYPEGGFDGAYVQTAGTGGGAGPGAAEDTGGGAGPGAAEDTGGGAGPGGASHGLFVASDALAADAEVGDHVEVVGTVEEQFGLTTIVATEHSVLDEPVEAVKPTEVTFPMTEEQRESLEGMLVAPRGDLTVTNNYATNQFGEIGLAAGTTPLPQPTDVERPRTAEYDALVADNERRLVTLDDGRSTNFLSGAARHDPVSWLRGDNEVRVGAPARVSEPVVLDYRFGLWRLQPTEPLTAETEPVTFGDTREAAPGEVPGDVRIAAFNVLNYFVTTGESYEDAGMGTCRYYEDRDGDPITVDTCTGVGPRGAADEANLARQEAKIVEAVNSLDVDVVALQEIENSAAFGLDRDTALRTLVGALNEDAGRERWAAVLSPDAVPEGEDVIRTAFIHDAESLEAVGESVILGAGGGAGPWAADSTAFDNAREPLAQTFRPTAGGPDDDFVVINNHFKSKGSGEGDDADTGDGQGGSNASRVRQATALVGFAQEQAEAAGTELTFLTGDFNSYSREDPVEVILDAGFVDAPRSFEAGYTYQFGGQVGSLDHVFASEAAFERVTGADIWSINTDESVGREYSRFNTNVTSLFDESVFRASDHDPVVVGFALAGDDDPGRSPSLLSVTDARTGLLGRLSVEVTTPGRVVDSGVVLVRRGFLPVGLGVVRDGAATAYVAGLQAGREYTVDYSGDPATKGSSTTYRVPG
ncbi:ExeM/NucH family extracellular endonuclease [Aeromicrobium sp. CTD01-1L150]|uniref:ExeM/NucH family extracellular endonuclease n=1 Tax=Aeromicrobium sp. CTD01-1L150 TaxID=3341830 RepID=UPI0035C0A90E